MIDFFKIKDGELGAVNFNNMIPVTDKNYTLVDLNKETLTIAELKYQKLLKEQLKILLMLQKTYPKQYLLRLLEKSKAAGLFSALSPRLKDAL